MKSFIKLIDYSSMTCTCAKALSVKYNEQYDGHYCETCNKWLENKCSDTLRVLFSKTRHTIGRSW